MKPRAASPSLLNGPGCFASSSVISRNNFLSVPAFYALRFAGGRLHWLFERYRPVCAPNELPGGRGEFDIAPAIGVEGGTTAFSARSFLAAVCDGEVGRVIRVRAPARVLEDVVKATRARVLEYHPLDGDTSWWPAPRSRGPGPEGAVAPSAAAPQ